MKRTFLVLIIVLAGAISAFAVETQQASASSEMAVADTSRIENLSDTAAVVATLSSEEREAIADVVREEMNSNRSFYNDDMPVRIVERLVAIVAIVMPFIAIIFIAAFLIIHSTKRQRIKYEVMEKAISANYKLPNDMFEEKKEGEARRRHAVFEKRLADFLRWNFFHVVFPFCRQRGSGVSLLVGRVDRRRPNRHCFICNP